MNVESEKWTAGDVGGGFEFADSDFENELIKIIGDENGNVVQAIINDYTNLYDMHKRGVTLFKVDSENPYTYKIVNFGETHTFDQTFRRLFYKVMMRFMEKGRAFIEIRVSFVGTSTFTEKSQVRQVLFLPLNAQEVSLKSEQYFFKVSNKYVKEIPLSVHQKFVIELKLSDLGLDPQIFRKAINEVLLVPKVTSDYQNLMKVPAKAKERIRQRNMALLKATKSIFYCGRYVPDDSFDDFYFFYRKCNQLALRRKILDYVIKKINDKVNALNNDFLRDFKIVCTAPQIDYISYFNNLYEGKITIEKMMSVLK